MFGHQPRAIRRDSENTYNHSVICVVEWRR